MGKNEKMNDAAAKFEIAKLGIEAVSSLLTLALTNADKANERLHASLTSERPDAVVQIAEKEIELAEKMFDKAFDLLERQMDAQEKMADARLREAEASYLRAERLSDSSAYSEGYRAAMADMEEDSDDDDVAAG